MPNKGQSHSRNVSCLSCRTTQVVGGLFERHADYCFKSDEWKRARRYMLNLRIRAKRRAGRVSELTTEDILMLCEEANITVWDIGPNPDDYCLARYGDAGDYVIGNCRFIKGRDNTNEMTHGPKSAETRAKMRASRYRYLEGK